jgi:hypothetical protein
MKKFFFPALALVFALVLGFVACKDELVYELGSLTAGGLDLNGASSATGVDPKASVVATFSEAINTASISANNVTLTRDYDKASVPLTVSVSGNTVTIDPVEDLGTGTLYELSFGNGISFADGKATLPPFKRTFTTKGTFAPAGAVAYWTFEGNGDDIIGAYDAAASVAVTYTDSRNAAAGKAATFDGDASIMEIANGDKLMNSTNFALSFWVKTNSTGHVNADGNPAGHFVIGLAAFKGFQFEIPADYKWCKLAGSYALADGKTASEDLFFNGDGKTRDNGGWQGWDFSKDLTASGGVDGLLKDKWANVVCVYNGATRQGTMYINGEKMKSFDFDLWPDGDVKRGVTGMKYGGVAPEVVNKLAFGFVQSRDGQLWDVEPWGGYDFPTANHFKGQLDDVRIYNKVLTDNEVRLMYLSEK